MNTLKNVVVTGSAGYLGSNLIPKLLDQGFTVTGIDMAAPRDGGVAGVRYVQADLADADATRDALRGAELICHVASVHPWKEYTDAQYIDANIKGTWNLYKLAAELGIKKVVLTSSIAGAGYGFKPSQWPVDESVNGVATDMYTFTKMAQEQIARGYAFTSGIQTFALRPPAFMPKPNLEIGFGLTGNYGVVSDVVAAHVAAARVLAGLQPEGADVTDFEAFFTTNYLPYTAADYDDAAYTGSIQLDALARHFPQAAQYMKDKGFSGMWMAAVYDLRKAKRILNWSPAYNFEQWFVNDRS